MFTSIPKNTIDALTHVSRAMGKDDSRPNLARIYQIGTTLIAIDGTRIHAAKAAVAEPGTALAVEIMPSRAHPIMQSDGHEADTTFTGKLDGIMERSTGPDAVATFTIDAAFLRDAVADLTGAVTITLHGKDKGVELQGKTKCGFLPTWDCIMPLYSNFPSSGEPEWKPILTAEAQPC